MLVFILVSVFVLLFDQISKILIVNNMSLYEEKVIIKDFFSLYYTKNDGIAFSMQVPLIIMIVLTIAIIVGIIIFFIKSKYNTKNDLFIILSLAFILGGALGNLVDRAFRIDHMVIDFLSFTLYYPSFSNGFHFESFPFAIFNVADSFLVIGSIMMAIYFLFIEGHKNGNKI